MTEKKLTKAAVQDLSFEQAMEELDTIVRALESGQAPLSDSVSSYERGVALKQHCEELLKQAQAKIEKITVGSDGAIQTEPLDKD
tara:strand:+ start:1127 stop:1381 length:255 start_codon:yes stop_codon:yes gene_type:complete